MYYKKEFGACGEDIATKFLIDNGFTIIQKNYHCKLGEIDIIAIDNNLKVPELCFIEVKSRHNNSCGSPAASVTIFKQHHIINTANFFICVNKLEKAFVRFDIIEVYDSDTNNVVINHIKNAFSVS